MAIAKLFALHANAKKTKDLVEKRSPVKWRVCYLSMPIANLTWQARVGIFNSSKPLFKSKIKNRGMLQFLLHCTVYSLYLFLTFILIKQVNNLYQVSSRLIKIIPAPFHLRFVKITDITVFLLFFIQNLLSCCGDIEENPGPKYSSLTFCYWNLNGLTAHDSTKISLLQAYITQRNYDIICLAETFLNSSILSDDNRIKIDGYSLIRSDHPSDSKKSEICIYYKEHIPLILRDDINTLDNCLVTETRSQNEKCFLTCIYRSPSQNQDEFNIFCTNFDILLNNINDELLLCSIVTGDFQFLINVIILLFMVKLTYVYLSLQHTCERSGIIKKQIFKILIKQYLTLIGIKLLKICP